MPPCGILRVLINNQALRVALIQRILNVLVTIMIRIVIIDTGKDLSICSPVHQKMVCFLQMLKSVPLHTRPTTVKLLAMG